MTRSLSIPRGTPNKDPIQFDMNRIDYAESRLPEVKVLNLGVVADLKSVFAEAMSDLGRYLATARFEYLQAKQQMELARAEALLDKYPDYVKSTLKDNGMKDNSDIREAFINRDPMFAHWQSVINHLDAMISLLEAKNKTVERAYWDCRSNMEDLMKINNSRAFNSESSHGSITDQASQPGIQPSGPSLGMSMGRSRF